MKRAPLAGILCMVLVSAPVMLAADPAIAAAPGIWSEAGVIETDDAGDADTPDVTMDASGNAIAVWRQFDGTRYNIWSNRFVGGTGWGTAQLIETENTADAWNPSVAVDGNGNVLAVWQQSDGTRYNIWSNRYVAGTGWGAAQLIETDNAGHAQVPDVAVDASGNAVAVWQQSDGTRYNVWSNRYVAGTGWGTAQLIETDDAGGASWPQVAVDASGNAVAVWQQYDGTRENIWSNRYVGGTGWGTAQLIETDNAGDAWNAQVALGANAVAVWQQHDGTRFNIWSSRYVPGTGWGTAQLIETDNAGGAEGPQVAMDGSGNAVAVWNQNDGARYNIWSNRYVAGTGWGTAQLIETDNAGGAYAPQVVADESGNALVVWAQSDGARFNIWSNRYVAGTGWGTARLSETDNAGSASGPQVAADASGNAIAVWQQFDGATYNIWSDQFREDYPPHLALSAPVDGASTNMSTAWVSGFTEYGAVLSVNGVAAVAGPDGAFGIRVALAPGVNVLNATAWDRAGNRATVTVNVTYNDPVPGLQQNLADAQAQLDAANADLAAAQAAVVALQSASANSTINLAAADARISALEANKTNSQGAAAPSDNTIAILAVAFGVTGVAVGMAALLRSGRRPIGPPIAPPPADPPSKP